MKNRLRAPRQAATDRSRVPLQPGIVSLRAQEPDMHRIVVRLRRNSTQANNCFNCREGVILLGTPVLWAGSHVGHSAEPRSAEPRRVSGLILLKKAKTN